MFFILLEKPSYSISNIISSRKYPEILEIRITSPPSESRDAETIQMDFFCRKKAEPPGKRKGAETLILQAHAGSAAMDKFDDPLE
jgi:hypothetical protein